MTIRSAKPADAPAIARIHVETWQAAYRGLIPDELLDGLDIAQRTTQWTSRLERNLSATFVAEVGREVIGFCSLMPCQDDGADPKQMGDIVALYIAQPYWRHGAGRMLTEHTLQKALEAGHTAVSLWVLTTNTPARRFYEALGFAPDGAAKLDKRHGPELHETRYRREIITGGPGH